MSLNNLPVGKFLIEGTINEVSPLGNGLINDTYLVTTREPDTPDYVLQRINHSIFTNVDLLQHNIDMVTHHIRKKLMNQGCTDISRRVLQFMPTTEDKTYFFDGSNYWRLSVFIPDTQTFSEVTPEHSYDAGIAFGRFEQILTDLPEPLGETIPDFHNMELRMRQLREAVTQDAAGRVVSVHDELQMIWKHSEEMCKAEKLHREGVLPKRICHCDTKINNMLFDSDGRVLCVIDLDTVMPSFVFSDYGDFLRTAANSEAEDSPDFSRIFFRMDIFEAFTRGYLESASNFLLPIELTNLPYAVALFPFMQAVRFLTDYLNGDTYYKIKYADHNLVRTRNQLRYFQCVEEQRMEMEKFIKSVLT